MSTASLRPTVSHSWKSLIGRTVKYQQQVQLTKKLPTGSDFEGTIYVIVTDVLWNRKVQLKYKQAIYQTCYISDLLLCYIM